MDQKLPIEHTRIIEYYKSLFSDISIYNKKGNLRAITELIINALLSKYIKVNDESSIATFTKKIELLSWEKRISKKHVPAFYFLYKEGNFGSHPSTSSSDAGEISYLEASIICIKPIIKRFFDDEGLNSNFLNENISLEVMNLKNIIEKEQLENKISTELLAKIKKQKKILIYTFASVLTLLLVVSAFLIKSLNSDLNISQEKIKEYVKSSSSQNELIKSKQAKIDSLNLIIKTSQQKSNINNGIQNDFKGKVDNVTNVGKVDKLEI